MIHAIPKAITDADWIIDDPGNAGTIQPTFTAYVPLVSAAAETRTLADPRLPGQMLVLACKTYVGDITITASSGIDVDGNVTLKLGAAGDYVVLLAIDVGGSYVWRVIG